MNRNNNLTGRRKSVSDNNAYEKSSASSGRLDQAPANTEKKKRSDKDLFSRRGRPYSPPQGMPKKYPDETADRRYHTGLEPNGIAISDPNSEKNEYYLNLNNYLLYKGYVGKVWFSANEAMLCGKVIGIKSLLSFKGDSVSNIIDDFHRAVDDYNYYCSQNGIMPEKPFKGSFNIRIGADLHRMAALAAYEQGISLNALVENAIRQAVDR